MSRWLSVALAGLVILTAAWNSGMNTADARALANNARGADPAATPCNTNGLQQVPCPGLPCHKVYEKCKQANPGLSQTKLCDTNNGVLACQPTETDPDCFTGNQDKLGTVNPCNDPYPPGPGGSPGD